MLFVCVRAWSPAADSWGQTRSNQTFGALNNVCVCSCVLMVDLLIGW